MNSMHSCGDNENNIYGIKYLVENETNFYHKDEPVNKLNLPELEQTGKYELLSKENIDTYFTNVVKNSEISCINGVPGILDVSILYCDLCERDLVFKNTSDCYYCNHCFKDICAPCHNNDKEHKCSTEFLKSRNWKNRVIFCDVCKNLIVKDEKRYNAIISDEVSTDVCLQCKDSDSGHKMINEHEMALVDNMNDWHEFGSLLDWYPIMFDEGTYILYNINADSKYKGQVAIAFSSKSIFPFGDDDKAYEYYTIQQTFNPQTLVDDVDRCLKQRNKE